MAQKKHKVLSLFSGAMGLDIGLELAGLDVKACIEVDHFCCETIRRNRPNIRVYEQPIQDLTGQEILDENKLSAEHTVLVGGPPCQSFSSAGNRAGLNDPRGNLIFEYFRFVREIRPACFVFENVGNLLTAALRHRPIDKRPGKNWNLSSYSPGNAKHIEDGSPPLEHDEHSGSAFKYLLNEIMALSYSITFGIVNAADFGAPQKRIRFVMLGFRDIPAPAFPKPIYGIKGKPRYATLRDAIYSLRDNPGAHSVYTDRIASFFKRIPPGGNWRSLPIAAQKEILGRSFFAGGGKCGFMRRLAWDNPCPTLTAKPNRKGTALCHPDDIRPLSVKEYARIQGFPDDWIFIGAMNQVYQQIGNAVPIVLGATAGQHILHHLRTKPKSKETNHSTHKELMAMYENSIHILHSYARNKKIAIDNQPNLFKEDVGCDI